MLTLICSKWWMLLLRGILAIVVGVMAIAWPGITLLTLMILFAVFALTDGVANIWLGFHGGRGHHWWEMVLLGLLGIAAGIVAILYPGLTILALVMIIAASAIVRGIVEIVAAIKLRKVLDDEWLLILSGALSIIFGIFLFVRPGAGAALLAIIVGIYFIVFGVVAILISLRLRNLYHRLVGRA